MYAAKFFSNFSTASPNMRTFESKISPIDLFNSPKINLFSELGLEK